MGPFQRIFAGALMGSLLATVAACNGETGMQLTFGQEPDTVEVVLTESFTFSPAEVTIPAGTVVRWINAAPIFHTITADGHNEWARATLSDQGETFEHLFEVPGTYPYYCEVHLEQDMTGVIIVQ